MEGTNKTFKNSIQRDKSKLNKIWKNYKHIQRMNTSEPDITTSWIMYFYPSYHNLFRQRRNITNHNSIK
jgi:hypothetical protein